MLILFFLQIFNYLDSLFSLNPFYLFFFIKYICLLTIFLYFPYPNRIFNLTNDRLGNNTTTNFDLYSCTLFMKKRRMNSLINFIPLFSFQFSVYFYFLSFFRSFSFCFISCCQSFSDCFHVSRFIQVIYCQRDDTHKEY